MVVISPYINPIQEVHKELRNVLYFILRLLILTIQPFPFPHRWLT